MSSKYFTNMGIKGPGQYSSVLVAAQSAVNQWLRF
jgi:hypothetical protein